MKVLSDFEPKRVFKYFEEICAIPHGSGNTRRIREYLVNFAAGCGLKSACDDIGNVVIYKPASPGYENAPAIILQGHMDMVAVATPESGIDMTSHKLELQVAGDYLSARNTSLGGDDGIAVAMILAMLEADDISHPPIEALFTVDEETGMYGARDLDISLLHGKRLINIDSEEEGYIYVGCAGGARVYIEIPVTRVSSEPDVSVESDKDDRDGRDYYEIVIRGCTGGHSGSEIDKGRANANFLAGRLLYEVIKRSSDSNDMTNVISLVSIEGGHADNAIATSCSVVVKSPDISEVLKSISDEIMAEYRITDPDLEIVSGKLSHSEAGGVHRLIPADSTKRIAEFLISLPNGVQSMSAEIDGLVETSLNLGIIHTTEDNIVLQFAVRSSVSTAKAFLIDRLIALGQLIDANVYTRGDYPGWEYRSDSELRDLLAEVYRRRTGSDPVIKVIHAGLECGFLASAIKGLDCVSIGPDMENVHTVNERLSISSTARTWEYLCEVLKDLISLP